MNEKKEYYAGKSVFLDQKDVRIVSHMCSVQPLKNHYLVKVAEDCSWDGVITHKTKDVSIPQDRFSKVVAFGRFLTDEELKG